MDNESIDGPSLSNASASVLDTLEVLPSAEGSSSTTGARSSSTTGARFVFGNFWHIRAVNFLPEPLRANTTINIDYCRGIK